MVRQFQPSPGWITLQATDGDQEVETRTCLEFLNMNFNISEKCYVRFCTIVDSREVVLDEGLMLPKLVDVTIEPVAAHCFWRGADVEFAPKIARHRKRKPEDKPKEPFVRKVASRKGKEAATDDASGPSGSDGHEIARLAEAHGINMQAPSHAMQVDDEEYDPSIDSGGDGSDVDLSNETELDSLIEQMCAPIEEQARRSDEQTLADLLEDFFAESDGGNGKDGKGDIDNVSVPESNDCDCEEPLHPSEEGRANPITTEPVVASPKRSRSSDSSSDSSESESSGSGGAAAAPSRPQHQRILEAGAKSSSLFDDSTVWVGPVRFVKRFHPVSCLEIWFKCQFDSFEFSTSPF